MMFAYSLNVPFTIPADIRLKFPLLSDLIEKSESMNDEERQYWVDILPVMTPEQITQLQGILQNERDQLAAIDAKYNAQISAINESTRSVEEIGAQRMQKKEQRSAQEQTVRSEEVNAAEDILKQME